MADEYKTAGGIPSLGTNSFLSPSVRLLCKLGSIAVHADEASSPDGNRLDLIALHGLLHDPEVVEWLDRMRGVALLPIKRRKEGINGCDVKITIKMSSGDVEVRALRIVGDFAVHNTLLGNVETVPYTVTHIPSGWAVKASIERLDSAIRLAKLCNSVPQWKLLKPQAVRPRKGSRIALQSTIPKSLRAAMEKVLAEWRSSQ